MIDDEDAEMHAEIQTAIATARVKLPNARRPPSGWSGPSGDWLYHGRAARAAGR